MPQLGLLAAESTLEMRPITDTALTPCTHAAVKARTLKESIWAWKALRRTVASRPDPQRSLYASKKHSSRNRPSSGASGVACRQNRQRSSHGLL